MEKINKMIGVVTLYNPKQENLLHNIAQFAPYLDKLIVWDNSPHSHKDWFVDASMSYHWTGQNTCIAPALNYTWEMAVKEGFTTILLMDQDSTWVNFKAYRKDIEERMTRGENHVFTPYVIGCDIFAVTSDLMGKRLFINSGAVIPVSIYSAIGPRDEKAFPIDALDHDIAFALIEHRFKTVCLTRHELQHSIGNPKRVGPFHRYTPDYNAFRTYHMTRSHIICYRMHRQTMNADERSYFFEEILLRKFFRIILLESDKYQRMKAFLSGIYYGITYKTK